MRNFTHTENLFRVPPEVIEQLTIQADAGDALACFKVGRYHYVVQPDEDSIEKAIDYIEKNGLTSGYTSVIYKTEDENIGFWYENLKVCQKELAETRGNSTLENTNVLMKLRESLTDEAEKGTKLTIPAGIYLYPNNALFLVVNWISGFVIVAFIIWIMAVIKAGDED